MNGRGVGSGYNWAGGPSVAGVRTHGGCGSFHGAAEPAPVRIRFREPVPAVIGSQPSELSRC